MKSVRLQRRENRKQVASFAEAWIEIVFRSMPLMVSVVASFAEAWIEIVLNYNDSCVCMSPPSRRRGLKFVPLKNSPRESGRLLRGGVD